MTTPSLRLTSDSVTADLVRTQASMTVVVKVAGAAMRNELIAHFRKKNTKPNKLGGARTNYWSSAADSVTSLTQASKTQVSCTVTQPGVSLHAMGGTVRPKRSKYLTIPVHPAAHGRSVKSFDNVRFGKGVVIVNDLVYYVLKRSANIPKDSDALPNDAKLTSAIDRAMAILAKRKD